MYLTTVPFYGRIFLETEARAYEFHFTNFTGGVTYTWEWKQIVIPMLWVQVTDGASRQFP